MARYVACLTLVLVVFGSLAEAAQTARRKPRRRPTVALPGEVILTEDFEKADDAWTLNTQGVMKWIEDRKASRTGVGCMMGSVAKPNNANRLERVVTFRKDALYRFEVWARSDNPQGKLVLWASQGRAKRRMLANWRFVGKRWRRCQGQFSVPEGGAWKLEVILPSSHGAPPSAMWVDDLKLVETRIPPSIDLTQKNGYNTEPSLAVDAAGDAWVSWISFRDKADVLMVGRLAPAGDGAKMARSWPVQVGKGAYVHGPVLTADGKGVRLVYAAEFDGNWDIWTARVDANGPKAPARVTASPAVDALPAAAVFDGKLWIAWESNRAGRREVYVSPAEAPKPQLVSDPEVNSYNPSVVGHDGELCVAWHAYVRGNYDIYGRRVRPGGAPGAVTRLTADGDADRHAVLASGPSGLWLAWQRDVQKTRQKGTRAYKPGNVSDRQTWLCRWTGQGLEKPAGLETTILPKGTEMPTLTVDSQGRVWVTARRARGRMGWDSVLQCFAGGVWGQAHHLSTQLGWDGRAGLGLVGDRVLVAYQVGYTPSFPNVEASLDTTSDIALAALSAKGTPDARAPEVTPLVEKTDPHWLALLRSQLGEESPRRTVTIDGQTYNLYWGDLHEHSSISQCNRWRDISPYDSHCYERDLINADFTAVTDHGYNFCPALWHELSKVVRICHDPNRFVTFLAEEWTSTHEKKSAKYPEGYYGHRNLVWADPYFPRWYNARDEMTPRELWDDLRRRKANFVNIPHQLADTGNVPVDWGFADKTAQPVAEIFQARQSYEYSGAPRQAGRTIDGHFIQDAWAKGVVIGVIASPDHGGGQGKAAIYAKELTREALLDALRARRCYGTSAARIFLDVRVNGRPMGGEIEVAKGEPVVVEVKAIGTGDLDRVEVCRSNEFVYAKTGKGRELEFTYRDLQPRPGRSYYYVRVQQKDTELAWSSPVWVTAR